MFVSGVLTVCKKDNFPFCVQEGQMLFIKKEQQHQRKTRRTTAEMPKKKNHSLTRRHKKG